MQLHSLKKNILIYYFVIMIVFSINKKIYWTNGFYNDIKIYNLNELSVLNDNSFYNQYIYYYLFIL